jgi:ankyrin repeat protein
MNRIDGELGVAARDGSLPEVGRLLIAGADVNAKDNAGYSAFHWACIFGHVQVVKEFLDHGADVEAKDKGDMSPLDWASMGGHLPVVKALLSGGTNNDYGDSPIRIAVSFGKSEVSKCLLQHSYATTRHLPLHALLHDLTWIGDPNSNIPDVPPLRSALHRNVLGTDDVVDILEYLVDRDPALLSSRDQDGSLPLHVACRRGTSFAIVQSLVNLDKASVKSVNSQGDLPLFLACEIPEPSLDTIFLLMKMYPDLVFR